MSNASATVLKPTAPAIQPLLIEMFKATPAYIFATAVMAALGKPAQR